MTRLNGLGAYRHHKRSVVALVAIAAALLALPATAFAADCPKTSLADIEDEVMCPVCGVPLSLATEAPQARRQRVFILDLVEQCRSKQEIKDALTAQFGTEVQALPDTHGFQLSAYLVPVLVLLAALAGVGITVLRWRRRPDGGASRRGERSTAAQHEPTAADGERLETDMRRYDL